MSRDVTLCILAGGEGRRMGRPKGELRIGGVPILRHLLDQISWKGPTMLVTAPGREHPPGWERFDREVVDPVAGLGPLRGLLTALENTTTDLIAVTTVDMPGITARQLDFLIERLRGQPEWFGVMARRTMRASEQIEPFPSVFRPKAKDIVAEELQAQRRSVYRLASIAGFHVIDAPPDWGEEVWKNLNTPLDIESQA